MELILWPNWKVELISRKQKEKSNPMGQGQAKRNTGKQRRSLYFYALKEEGPGAGQKNSNTFRLIKKKN